MVANEEQQHEVAGEGEQFRSMLRVQVVVVETRES